MKKKILVMMLALAMTLAFASCGGGSESGSEAEAPAEPNAGVGGIMFTVPDGWTPSNSSLGEYLDFNVPGSDYLLFANVFDDDDLENVNKWSPEYGAESVQAYYEKNYTSKEALSKEGLETSVIQVCGEDAQYNKLKAKSGEYLELGTSWMHEGKIYNLTMCNPDAYGENGEIVEDAAKLTDDDISLYESIRSSVQLGDGNAIQAASMNTDSIGSFTFEAPAGYTICELYNKNVSFAKDGSTITLSFSVTDEDGLKDVTDENGNHPASLKEWYEKFLYEGMEMTKIAGFDGHVDKYPYDDGKYYNVSAEFLADDGIYTVNMGSPDVWDENGEIVDGAETLSDEDLAVFDAFIASIAKK